MLPPEEAFREARMATKSRLTFWSEVAQIASGFLSIASLVVAVLALIQASWPGWLTLPRPEIIVNSFYVLLSLLGASVALTLWLRRTEAIAAAVRSTPPAVEFYPDRTTMVEHRGNLERELDRLSEAWVAFESGAYFIGMDKTNIRKITRMILLHPESDVAQWFATTSVDRAATFLRNGRATTEIADDLGIPVRWSRAPIMNCLLADPMETTSLVTSARIQIFMPHVPTARGPNVVVTSAAPESLRKTILEAYRHMWQHCEPAYRWNAELRAMGMDVFLAITADWANDDISAQITGVAGTDPQVALPWSLPLGDARTEWCRIGKGQTIVAPVLEVDAMGTWVTDKQKGRPGRFWFSSFTSRREVWLDLRGARDTAAITERELAVTMRVLSQRGSGMDLLFRVGADAGNLSARLSDVEIVRF
jgi:hypothetical protein